jgi:hypothetical protein
MAGRHQELEQLVSLYIEDWDRDFEEFRRSTEQAAEEMQRAHEEEIDEFDAATPIESCCRKRSPRLLQLRTREVKLAITKRFGEAERARRDADVREEEELEKAQGNERAEYLKNRGKVLAAQEKSLNALAVKAEEMRKKLVTKRDKKVAGYLRRMNNLGQELGTMIGELGIEESEVCEGEPDQKRGERAYRAEMGSPVAEFFKPGTAGKTKLSPRESGVLPASE